MDFLEKTLEFYNRSDIEEILEKENEKTSFWLDMQHHAHYGV